MTSLVQKHTKCLILTVFLDPIRAQDICTSARHLQSKCHGIVVLAIDFESELGSTLAGMGEYRNFCDSTHAIEQTSASDEGSVSLQMTPSKKSGRRRQATKNTMMGGMGGTTGPGVWLLSCERWFHLHCTCTPKRSVLFSKMLYFSCEKDSDCCSLAGHENVPRPHTSPQ